MSKVPSSTVLLSRLAQSNYYLQFTVEPKYVTNYVLVLGLQLKNNPNTNIIIYSLK